MRTLVSLAIFFMSIEVCASDVIHYSGLIASDPQAAMECKVDGINPSRKCMLTCDIQYPKKVNLPDAYGNGFTVENVENVEFHNVSRSGGTDRSWVAWKQWVDGPNGNLSRSVIGWAYIGSNMHCQAQIKYEPEDQPTGKIINLHVTRFIP